MIPEFFLTDFLRHINADVFNQYLESKSLPTIDVTDKDEDNIEAMVQAIKSAEKEKYKKIVEDLILARELSTEGGIASIHEVARDRELLELLSKQENNQSRALLVFVKNEKVFISALTLKQIVSTTNFYTRSGLVKIRAKEALGRKQALVSELKSYLQSKERRGSSCRVDSYQFDDRICFIAYPEDHPKTYLFYEDKSLKRQVHSPSFQLVYVYYPEEGRVELSARVGYKKRQEFFNLFNRSVLNDLNPVKSYQKELDLNRIVQPDFNLRTEPEDQVESVFLSQIRLDDKYNHKKRTIIQIDEGEGVETMFEEMRKRNFTDKSLGFYNVYQVTIKFKFKQFGRRNRVTMQLTMPDRDGLDETASNQLAKKYIKVWDLINDKDSTAS